VTVFCRNLFNNPNVEALPNKTRIKSEVSRLELPLNRTFCWIRVPNGRKKRVCILQKTCITYFCGGLIPRCKV